MVTIMEIPLGLFFHSHDSGHSSDYCLLRQRFLDFGVTYLRQVLLRRIAEDAPFKAEDIEDKIQKIADILLLNPLELAYWEMLLHSTSTVERSMDVPLLYLYTAYLAKASLNDSVALFEHELTKRIRGFKMSYDNWMLMTNCPLMPDMLALNQRFTQMLSHHHRYRDYEAMINSLMVIPRRKDSLASDKSDGSTISNVNFIQTEFNQYMGNERLSPINEY